MKVDSPEGRWHVRRRWAPRHLRENTIFGWFRRRTRGVRRRTSDVADIPSGCVGDLGEAIALVVVVVFVVVLVLLVGIPLLIALGELVLILLLAFFGLIGRVLFRRPWTVDALSPAGEHREWPVVGWRASAAVREFVAERVRTTGELPSDDEVTAAALGA